MYQLRDDAQAPITVWIDTTRQAAVDAFKKANPDKADLIQEVIVDRGEFPAKVLLFNNTNSGWPDVVFAEPSIVGQVSDTVHDFPLDLKDAVSADIIEGFGNSLALAGLMASSSAYAMTWRRMCSTITPP